LKKGRFEDFLIGNFERFDEKVSREALRGGVFEGGW